MARQEPHPPGASPVCSQDSRELQRHWAAATRLSGWAEAPGCVLHRRCARWRGRWRGGGRGLCPQAAAMRLESLAIAYSADQRAVARQEPRPPGHSPVCSQDSRELQRHWASARPLALSAAGRQWCLFGRHFFEETQQSLLDRGGVAESVAEVL